MLFIALSGYADLNLASLTTNPVVFLIYQFSQWNEMITQSVWQWPFKQDFTFFYFLKYIKLQSKFTYF